MTDQIRVYSYTGLAIHQQPNAPAMYVLGVDAPSLLEWADVPSAKADYMAGYQRVYNADRAKEIQEFIEASPNNIVPGAVIVAVDAECVDISETNSDGVVKITIRYRETDFETRLTAVHRQFSDRLSDAEKAVMPSDVDAAAIAEESEEAEESGIPDSYIGVLTEELKTAIDDMESLPEDRQQAIRNYIASISKPGLIIDGQHRVFGAKNVSQHNIALPIVLLPGLEVAEQVFHFYVLNNKAKPLSPTELRRTISTSLTNREIDGLWQRFENAGVNPEATRWTHKINTDLTSPFKGLISFGFEGSGFIKENVAYQLVSRFVNMPRKYRIIYKDVPAFAERNDERLRYFYAVWSAIRTRYQATWDAGVATGGSQLFSKAGMLVLQELILDQLVQMMTVRQIDGKPTPLADLDELQDIVKAVLNFLPPEFFTTEWQQKQLDTSERRAFLRGQMAITLQNQGKFLGNQQLFRKS